MVDTVHAPPAMTFLQELQFQIPTAVRFTVSCTCVHKTGVWIMMGDSIVAYLSAEGASVTCVLGDLHLHRSSASVGLSQAQTADCLTHLFDLLTQGGTVTLYPS